MTEITPLEELSSFFKIREESGLSQNDMKKAFETMHLGYTSGQSKKMRLVTSSQIDAYISLRRPATLQSACSVFSRLREVLPSFSPKSIVDIGTGPMTVLEAYHSVFSETLASACFIEAQPIFCAIITELIKKLEHCSSTKYRLIQDEVTSFSTQNFFSSQGDKFDMATLSYSIGELESHDRNIVIDRLMRSCRSLVLIEPGTPRGWATLMAIRDTILQDTRWTIVAPCPHTKSCPFTGTSDWCHETVRLRRSSSHIRIKGGSLSYEDEPFSYLIAVEKESFPDCIEEYGRIVHRPKHRSGHTHCTLCTPRGDFQEVTVSKKAGPLYQVIRKKEWGDIIPWVDFT